MLTFESIVYREKVCLTLMMSKGRSRENMQQHNKQMIGNTDTLGREIVLKQEPAFAVKKRVGKYSGKYELEKSHKEAFETAKKCKFLQD